MKIGIIGAGNIGGTLTRRFSALEHKVFVANSKLGRPTGSPGRIALPIAEDDAAAKKVVLQLIDEFGFDGVDTGVLDESWRQQPHTTVYATDLDADGVKHALAKASKERKPEWRTTRRSPGTYGAPA